MELSLETLKRLLGDAFDLGYCNSNEFKHDLIEELLQKMQMGVKPDDHYRIYKCAELKGMPEGTIFNHITRGRCWIVAKSDSKGSIGKAIQFQKGGVVGLINDNEPWDRPMRLLHMETA